MIKQLTRKKIIIVWMSCLLSITAYAETAQSHMQQATVREIEEILGPILLPNALYSFYAVNFNTKEVIRSINPHLSLVPASSLKLVTTATALEVLGEDFKFATTLQYDGKIDSKGTLTGNIYIQGGGDPSLGSKYFQSHYYEPYWIDTWVQAIKDQGIKKIKGAIIGDAQIYTDYMTPDTWVVEDLGFWYGSPYSGLSIFDNTYDILFGIDPKNDARFSIIGVTPKIPESMKIISQLKRKGNKNQYTVYGGPYQNIRIIRGKISVDKSNFAVKASIADPAYWAAYTLQSELGRHGIKITQQPRALAKRKVFLDQDHELELEEGVQFYHSFKDKDLQKEPLARTSFYVTYSPPLKDIIRITNTESHNMYAETILNHIGLQVLGKGDHISGLQAVASFLPSIGIDTTGLFMQDGSGLSRYNGATAKGLVDVLIYMKGSKNFNSFYKSFPIAGETGTLKTIFTKAPLKGNLKIKTGSMRRVRCYTGYCTNIQGEEVVFSLMINNYNGTMALLDAKVETLLTSLVNETSSSSLLVSKD